MPDNPAKHLDAANDAARIFTHAATLPGRNWEWPEQGVKP